MFIQSILLLSAVIAPPTPKAEAWYGPAEIQFKLATSGDPYDPAVNNLVVHFKQGSREETRLAFMREGAWHCRILAHVRGTYHAKAYLNGQPLAIKLPSVTLSKRLAIPFIREDSAKDGFRFGTGGRYWPMGHDLAWNNSKVQSSITSEFPEMARNGVNWTRIWSTAWDGKNLYWPKDADKLPAEGYLESALQKWDLIVRKAEEHRLYFQWTLHYHGMVSTEVNPNWDTNPWNANRGGFLKKAEDFFTNPLAKSKTKAYLRYVVAQYGDSPAIMAWELFNEVQFSDAARHGHWDTVGEWHDEMANYLRSIDPYHHLITTSSEQTAPIWRKTDYRQDHGYPASISAMILGSTPAKGQPYFYGEIGSGENGPSAQQERMAMRDGIWGGIFACHAGSAEYWNWDNISRLKLYSEFRTAAKIMQATGYLKRLPFSRSHLSVSSSMGGALNFAPGRGWGSSEQQSFELPSGAGPEQMGRLSAYLQGSNHPEMGKPQTEFHFKAARSGVFVVRVAGAGQGGGALSVSLDGQSLFDQTWPAASANTNLNLSVKVPFGVGEHKIVLKNSARDWVQIAGFNVSGIGPSVSGLGVSSGSARLLRLQQQPGTKLPLRFFLSGLHMRNGTYVARVWNLDTGTSSRSVVNVKSGKAIGTLTVADAIYWIGG